jgi:hypothetical protein
VLSEIQGPQVQVVLQVHKAQQDWQEQLVIQDSVVFKGHKVELVIQDLRDQQGSKGHKEDKDLRVHRVHKDLRVFKGHKAELVIQDLRDRLGFKVHKD